AAGASFIIDDDRPPPLLRQLVAERTRQDVDAGAGRVGHDDRDRSARLLCKRTRRRDGGQCGCSSNCRKSNLSRAVREIAHNSAAGSVCSLPHAAPGLPVFASVLSGQSRINATSTGGGVGRGVGASPVLVVTLLPVPPPSQVGLARLAQF